jgi:hypothetical protein
MSDRRGGDRFDEVHVGGHQATVHAGSNFNTYTIRNNYYFSGKDAELPGQRQYELRERWQRVEQVYRESLEDATWKHRSLALQIGTLDELKDALQNFRTEGATDESGGCTAVVEELSSAFDSLVSFAAAIDSASRYPQVSALVWSAFLSVIEV